MFYARSDLQMHLTIHNEVPEYEADYKHQGIWIEKRNTLGKHIQYVKGRTTHRQLYLNKRLAPSTTFIRPNLDCRAPALFTPKKKNQNHGNYKTEP